MKKIIIASVFSALSLINMNASAQITSNFNVNTSLNGFCSVSVGNVNFGIVAGKSTAVSSITVLCSKNLAYRVKINEGLNFSSGYKKLKGLTRNDLLSYNLYLTPTSQISTNEWEENVNRNFIGTGEVVELPIHGTLSSAASHWKIPDDYTDTLVVTVTY